MQLPFKEALSYMQPVPFAECVWIVPGKTTATFVDMPNALLLFYDKMKSYILSQNTEKYSSLRKVKKMLIVKKILVTIKLDIDVL